MVLWPKNRPIPSRHRSIIASIGWFPETGRDWKRCCCSWSPEKSRRVQVQGHLTLRMVWRKKKKRRQADRRGSRVKGGEGHGGSGGPLPWPTSAAGVAAIIILQRCVPSSFFFSASFCSASPSVLLGSLTAHSFLLHAFRRGECRRGDAPLDPLPLFASFLC